MQLQGVATQWDGNSATSAIIVRFRKSHLASRGVEDVVDFYLLKEDEQADFEVSRAECVSFSFMYYKMTSLLR